MAKVITNYCIGRGKAVFSGTAEEKERLEDLDTKSILFFLVQPLGIILFLCLVLFVWITDKLSKYGAMIFKQLNQVNA